MAAVISVCIFFKSIKIGEFCVAILIWKMGDNKQHLKKCFIFFTKGKNTTEMQKKYICAVYGEGAVTDGRCQKWFVKFCAGDVSLDGAPWLGRPFELESNQIKTLIENNQYYTAQEIADILKVSKSMKLLVKIKKCVFYFMEKIKQTFQPTR